MAAPEEPEPTAGRPGSRHEARKRALDILYEADLLDQAVAAVLADHLEGDDPPGEFSVALVRGVERHRLALDALPGLYVGGAALDGVGLSARARDAERLADAVRSAATAGAAG
jgi:transcription termination factor NusB